MAVSISIVVELYVLPYGQMSLWGINLCPKWFLNFFNIEKVNLNIQSTLICNSILPLTLAKTRSHKRIGPHNFDVLCILMGSLLGDAHCEKHGNGTRFCFQQEHSNNKYLLWFHSYLSNLGYCNSDIPKISTRLGRNGKMRYLSRFKTFTFTSFDWIHQDFYPLRGRKVIPEYIGSYLSPLALAV